MQKLADRALRICAPLLLLYIRYYLITTALWISQISASAGTIGAQGNGQGERQLLCRDVIHCPRDLPAGDDINKSNCCQDSQIQGKDLNLGPSE